MLRRLKDKFPCCALSKIEKAVWYVFLHKNNYFIKEPGGFIICSFIYKNRPKKFS